MLHAMHGQRIADVWIANIRTANVRTADVRTADAGKPERMTLAVEILMVSAPSPPVPTMSNSLPEIVTSSLFYHYYLLLFDCYVIGVTCIQDYSIAFSIILKQLWMIFIVTYLLR